MNNDDRFERDLRSLLSRAAPADVPSPFRDQIVATPYRRRRNRLLAPRRPFAVVVAAAVVIATAALAGFGISQLGPAATQPTTSSDQPTPAPSMTTGPVVLPLNAPLEPADCGWPASTPLAFAGYATVADLDAGQIIQDRPNEHVYALVSRDPVELVPMIGSPMLARGFCALRQDGSQTESATGSGGDVRGGHGQGLRAPDAGRAGRRGLGGPSRHPDHVPA
jgi:hypothetical protein